jgi:hypothetical protein
MRPSRWLGHYLFSGRRKMLMDRGHPSAVNFYCDGALKQAHGYHDSMVLFETLQDPLESTKSAAFDPHPLTDSDVRPRLAG